MPSSTQSRKTMNCVKHHLKHHVEDSANKPSLEKDSNGEKLSNMQLNSEQNCDVAGDMVVSLGKNRQQRWFGTFVDYDTHPTTDQSATTLSEEVKALEYRFTEILGRESGKVRAKESTGGPSSVPAISNGTGNLSQLSDVGDKILSGNEQYIETRPKSKALHSFQKETVVSETRKVIHGPSKNTGLNLPPKNALPRDSKGRFISYARLNGGEEGEISFSRWKQTDSHKLLKRSTNSAKTSTFHNEMNFVLNAALSNARSGKSTSMQTVFPVCRDFHGGKKCLSRDKYVPELNGAVAGQAAFSFGDFKIGSVGREFPLATTTLNHVEAPLSETATDLAKKFTQSRCSDYRSIGWPPDSQGGLFKYIQNTKGGANELYSIQNCTTGKEPLVAKCSKRLPEFNFVESLDVSTNISEVGRMLKLSSDSVLCNLKDPYQHSYSIPCKQADCCNQHSASKSNQVKLDEVGLVQSSSLDQIQSEYVGNSQIRTSGSTSSKTDTGSTMTACMHSIYESGYNREQKEKSSALEKTCSEVQSSRKERPTTQSVMRLMGHSFIIGGENEAINTLKEYHQSSDKTTPRTSEATLDVSSSSKSNRVYRGQYTAGKEGQWSFPYPGSIAFCQHSILKENRSECPQKNSKPMEANSFACNTADELRRLNSSVPKLVEKRFPTSCDPCQQPLKGQFYSEPTWTSSSPFCTPISNTLHSPVSHLSTNTVVNQEDKLAHINSCNYIASESGQTEHSRSGCNLHGTCFQNRFDHKRDPVSLYQKHVCSQNQSSSLVSHDFPKPVCSGYMHTSRIREAASNPDSLQIQSDAFQLLQNQSKCNSKLPQWLLSAQKRKGATEGWTSHNRKQYSAPVLSSAKIECVTKELPGAISNSVYSSDPLDAFTSALALPTFSQTVFPSYCETLALTDSATLNGKYKYAPLNLLERENIKVPKNMSRNICANSHDKGFVPNAVNLLSPESKCPSDLRRDLRKASFEETKELRGKWLLQKHEGHAEGPSQNCNFFLTGQKLHKRQRIIHHEINSSDKYGKNKEISENDFIDCKDSVEIAMGEDSHDWRNCSNKDKLNEIFSNDSLHSRVPQKCREIEETFRKRKSILQESQIGTSRHGFYGSSTESSLKLAEAMKLSGAAKHILKPPPQNGNVKQSFPIHYTLPFI